MRRAIVLAMAVLLPGCAVMQPSGDATATADLTSASGQSVGTAQLVQVGRVLRIVVDAKALPPGLHALHMHAVGKCDPPDFASAGPHFNPTNKQHGALNPQGSHAGDLPNLSIGSDGTGRLETATEQMTLGAGATSLWDADGSALVVHAAPDDFTTDPTGNAGGRIACGVVTRPTK